MGSIRFFHFPIAHRGLFGAGESVLSNNAIPNDKEPERRTAKA